MAEWVPYSIVMAQAMPVSLSYVDLPEGRVAAVFTVLHSPISFGRLPSLFPSCTPSFRFLHPWKEPISMAVKWLL